MSETQFLTTILEADAINHLVVFLTGATPLPVGVAGMVYWSWPDAAAPPNWQLLGHISNSKPSAIFKISNLKKLHELSGRPVKFFYNKVYLCVLKAFYIFMQLFSGDNKFLSAFGQQKICHNAQIGISIEAESNVQLLASSVVSDKKIVYTCLSHK